ncbi:MAG: DNA methylase [Mogibacterium sp.]|nr:DNA methylase [Mogibacterium sp.]
MDRTYVCIDLKSYYASVECVARGLDPMTTPLLVADESRSDQTICLAVSPALKAIGVPGRPRLFEAKRRIQRYEAQTGEKLNYIVAVPRMAEYIRVSAEIYEIYLRYICKDDIHVYSIDECFIDVTPYLHLYKDAAERAGVSPAHQMAVTMIHDVLSETGITATVGIGTNLYLAKVGMDIVAKHARPDKDGVRIAELDEDQYKLLLWDHRPLTDFWMIGPGTARKLQARGLMTLGDVATMALHDEEFFYRKFGVNAELLLDHVWGIEPCLMSDIKNYQSSSHSLSIGQVLPRPYEYEESVTVFREMAEKLVSDLFAKGLVTDSLAFWVSYDWRSLEHNPAYKGAVSQDFYGRLRPEHASSSVRLGRFTNNRGEIVNALLRAYDRKVDHTLLVRRIGVAAGDTRQDDGVFQLDMFTDYDKLERDRSLQEAMQAVRQKFGDNSLITGTSLREEGTGRERNNQIGGHKA